MKTKKQLDSEWTRRRANIRRGMKIALYEMRQELAPSGVNIIVPSWFVPYTVAVAEAGRRDATSGDRASAVHWTRVRANYIAMEIRLARLLGR